MRLSSCSMRNGGGDDTGISTSTHSGVGVSVIEAIVRRGDGYPGGNGRAVAESTHTSSCESKRTRMLSPMRPVSCTTVPGSSIHLYVPAGVDRPMTTASVLDSAAGVGSPSETNEGRGLRIEGRVRFRRTVSGERATYNTAPLLSAPTPTSVAKKFALVLSSGNFSPPAETHALALVGARTETRTGSSS